MKKFKWMGISLMSLVMFAFTTLQAQAVETEQSETTETTEMTSVKLEAITYIKPCEGMIIGRGASTPIYDNYCQETGRTYGGADSAWVTFTQTGRHSKFDHVLVYVPELAGWIDYHLPDSETKLKNLGLHEIFTDEYKKYYGLYTVTENWLDMAGSDGLIVRHSEPGEVIQVVGVAMDAFDLRPGYFILSDGKYVSLISVITYAKKTNEINLENALESFKYEGVTTEIANIVNRNGMATGERLTVNSKLEIIGKSTVNGYTYYKLSDDRFVCDYSVKVNYEKSKEELPENTIGITKNSDGLPATVYQSPGGKATGRTLQRATAWKTFFKCTLADTTYYQVAYDQWLKADEFEIIDGAWAIGICAQGEIAWVDKAAGIPVYFTPGGEKTGRILVQGSGWKTFFLAKNLKTGETYYQVAPDQWLKLTDIRL